MDSGSLMRADLWTYLSENCLAKTDRASMLHSLEVRVPMLANAVLDRVLALPARVHFDAAGGKVLLRRLAQKHLPEQVWNRPKHGFSVPLKTYFNGQWQNVGDELFDRSQAIAPFLQNNSLSALWNEAKAGKASRRLAYTFLVLLIWLDKYKLDA
jgi:asparagine synthase (glutamine-hydrolysing)